MKYPLHKSDTGSFQELAKVDDVDFAQLSILTIEPKCSRGDHYHERKNEWFCCIHGECTIELTDILDKTQKIIKLTEEDRQFIHIKTYQNHTVRNIGDEECEILIICDETYDENDADTFKMEEELEEVVF